MKQGLLIIVLLLLVLLLSCKFFNYCVLKELFVNKEKVKLMMDDIYESFLNEKRKCTETEKSVMTSMKINKECSNPETFVGTYNEHFKGRCDPDAHDIKELREAGKCPGTNPPSEGFIDCCTDKNSNDDIINGVCVPCEGYENYCPFKETFEDVPTPDISKYLPRTRKIY